MQPNVSDLIYIVLYIFAITVMQNKIPHRIFVLRLVHAFHNF